MKDGEQVIFSDFSKYQEVWQEHNLDIYYASRYYTQTNIII